MRGCPLIRDHTGDIFIARGDRPFLHAPNGRRRGLDQVDGRDVFCNYSNRQLIIVRQDDISGNCDNPEA